MNDRLLKDFECLVEEQKIIGVSPQGKEFADFDRWLKEFPEYSNSITQWNRRTLNFLDRADVSEFSQLSIELGNLAEAFLIVMIWGYSGDARGPARTRQIMEQPSFLDSLKISIDFLKKNEVAQAYDCLVVSGPKHLSTSFGSKLLYFFSDSTEILKPLIFDRRIFQVLDELGMAVGKSPVLTSKQYMDYLELASRLAEKLNLSLSEVEEHLFIFSGLIAGNYGWKRKVSFETLTDDQRNKLALLLANSFASRLSNPSILLNGNGGGQYGGYVATGLLEGVEYELHSTTNRNVNLIEPEMIRIEWDLVLLRGIAQTVRDLLPINN